MNPVERTTDMPHIPTVTRAQFRAAIDAALLPESVRKNIGFWDYVRLRRVGVMFNRFTLASFESCPLTLAGVEKQGHGGTTWSSAQMDFAFAFDDAISEIINPQVLSSLGYVGPVDVVA